jgi:hypothetical protein
MVKLSVKGFLCCSRFYCLITFSGDRGCYSFWCSCSTEVGWRYPGQAHILVPWSWGSKALFFWLFSSLLCIGFPFPSAELG